MTPASGQSPATSDVFFDYTDLFIFLGLCIPCLIVALLIAGMFAAIFARTPKSVFLLLVQCLWYFLIFGCVAERFRSHYQKPFWQSLGWRPISFAHAAAALLAGPLVAISIGLLGGALRAPEDIKLPFDQMLNSRGAVVLLGILVVILGPLAEELFFRGFLMPLLMRSVGVMGGILAAGLIFGAVHLSEYQWAWQYALIIAVAGSVFGWAKYKTQSTVTAALMHSTFNLLQFAALLKRSGTI